MAEEALKDIISPGVIQTITPELIIQVVAEHYNLTTLDLLSQRRSKEIVYPRQIAMYLCRNMTESPLQEIGKAMGGRDHTTIIHGTVNILKKKLSPN